MQISDNNHLGFLGAEPPTAERFGDFSSFFQKVKAFLSMLGLNFC